MPSPNDRSAGGAAPAVREVQLWSAPLPFPLGWLARHYWFVLATDEGAERWEVWQSRAAGGTSWGHVHRNLMAASSGVGGGPGRVEVTWNGDAALAIARWLRDPEAYPYRERYRVWPGPNSNTYAAWVLRAARLTVRWTRNAVGARWRERET